jgi:hypothetical protein
MLVHETMMEPADEDQVVQVGSAAPFPPPDVMRVNEAPGSAPGEPAFAVPIAEGSHHAGGRLSGHATKLQRLAALVFDHLEPGRAPQPSRRLGVDDAAALDLASALAGR